MQLRGDSLPPSSAKSGSIVLMSANGGGGGGGEGGKLLPLNCMFEITMSFKFLRFIN